MKVARSAADALSHHVTLELDCIDRMYLNGPVLKLQHDQGVYRFFHYHRGHRFASTQAAQPMTRAFVAAIERYARDNNVPLVEFVKKQRKDDVAQEHLARFKKDAGILFIGKAQEKTRVFRTTKRRNPKTGGTYPWMAKSTAMVNHYYFYGVDEDFGPFFIKFCSYFPYTTKVCINGHEYLKRQLGKEGIEFEALDNGLLRCAHPQRAQQIADDLSAEKIDAFFHRWIECLPSPFSADDRDAGYCHELFVLQAEFSRTLVFDRPLSGRVFFEEVMRENLDLGRPNQMQLVFQRRVTRATPGRFRTRIMSDGVVPSIHVDYKHSRIKQYFKEGRALRTETTINDTYDFKIGRRLVNLPRLREIGFQANRRLLDVQRVSQDCAIGEEAFLAPQKPVDVNGLRAPGLPFADPRVQALLHAILIFDLLPAGFNNRELKERLLPLCPPGTTLTPGRMSYDLRRLRYHGFIERLPKTHRYRPTDLGLRTALFFCITYNRILRPAAAKISSEAPVPLRPSLHRLEAALHSWCDRLNPT